MQRDLQFTLVGLFSNRYGTVVMGSEQGGPFRLPTKTITVPSVEADEFQCKDIGDLMPQEFFGDIRGVQLRSPVRWREAKPGRYIAFVQFSFHGHPTPLTPGDVLYYKQQDQLDQLLATTIAGA